MKSANIQQWINESKEMIQKFPRLTEVLKALGVKQTDLQTGTSADFVYEIHFVDPTLTEGYCLSKLPTGFYEAREDHGNGHNIMIHYDHGVQLLKQFCCKQFLATTYLGIIADNIVTIRLTNKDGSFGKNYLIPYTIDGIPGTLYIDVLGKYVTSIDWQNWIGQGKTIGSSICTIIPGFQIDTTQIVPQIISQCSEDLYKVKEYINERYQFHLKALKEIKETYGNILIKEEK